MEVVWWLVSGGGVAVGGGWEREDWFPCELLL